MDHFTSISPQLLWPYCAGLIISVIAIIRFARDWPLLRGWRLLFALGPVCFAIPMAVFGADHLSDARSVMHIVPAWMPGRLFWAYFVGLCLISAALSILFRIKRRLASLLLGGMLLSFVLLIHIPNVIAKPGDRILWILAARDLAFACGALLLGIMEPETAPGKRFAVLMQFVIAAIAIFYGIENLQHAECVPAVPLEMLIPSWMPFGRAWTSLTGVALILGGIGMLAVRTRQTAAAALGALVILSVLVVYLPIMIVKPDIESLNYVTDTLVFAGTFLAAASASAGWRKQLE